MPDINTGQRTFYMAFSGNALTNTIDVPFRDTAGNIIRCNYAKVRCVPNSTGAVGSFGMELSGVSKVGSIANITYGTGVATSGILGGGSIFGGGNAGEAEWHGSNGEVARGITIKYNYNGGSIHFGVTYGNLFPYNTLSSDRYDKGV